jgi:tetratricopeptide (TPR) repeat protein
MMRSEAPLAATENAEPSITVLMRSALEFHIAERYEMARDLYTQVLAQDPPMPSPGIISGSSNMSAEIMRPPPNASVACKPDYAQAYANLIAVFRAARQFDAAIESGEKAIALDPSFAAAHSNLGNVFEDKGDLEAALAAYLEACRLDLFLSRAIPMPPISCASSDATRRGSRSARRFRPNGRTPPPRISAPAISCATFCVRMRRRPPTAKRSRCASITPRSIATSAIFSSIAATSRAPSPPTAKRSRSSPTWQKPIAILARPTRPRAASPKQSMPMPGPWRSTPISSACARSFLTFADRPAIGASRGRGRSRGTHCAKSKSDPALRVAEHGDRAGPTAAGGAALGRQHAG